MSLTFPPLNNQATDPITTANSNSLSLSLVTLTSFSTTFITAISSASNMVSINLAPAISVAVTGQDVNFDTRLNVMENVIFKLGSPLEKFISVNHPSSKSQGENDRAYLTNFSVNASQSETDQSSDVRVTMVYLLERNLAGMLRILTFVEQQRIYLTRTLVCRFHMQNTKTNKVMRSMQQMI